jgi:hypothetical protein
MIYIYIAAFGFISIMFLTLRDIRIYRRTKLDSYRKGALRGMLTGGLAWFGMIVTAGNPGYESVGLTMVLVAVYFNNKGKREDVFGDAPLMKRVIGETTLKKL